MLFGVLAGERVPKGPRPISVKLEPILGPFRRRVALPLRRALNPDQPETIETPGWLAVLLLALGLVELAYGMGAVAAMGRWNTLAATHAFGFVVVGLLRSTSSLLLAAGRSSGRRLGVWAALFAPSAGLLAPLWLGVPFLLTVGSLATLSIP